MNNVMIDIEALDTKPTAAIASIAAAFFDPLTGAVGDTFYTRVDIEDSARFDGTIGASTVKWWLRQSAAARAELTSNDAKGIFPTLLDLNAFINGADDAKSVKIWARETDYDLPIIYSAMRTFDIAPCWSFWNVRDVRTVHEMVLILQGHASSRLVSDVAHQALCDVLNQIAQLTDNIRTISMDGVAKAIEASL
ncbi:3'-5' exonuclease [Citrobacter sp. FP75]|uniref:3'-5' exonuclease n=1 Tax=Citrobacter sp. FP75 TaxID=1852949 RepID=UPI001BC8ED56|nr:3'-5' exonuclease [Citrobacter sp. FP75]